MKTQRELHHHPPLNPAERDIVLQIAREAGCDARSVTAELAAYRGLREHVRGRAGDRIRHVLERRGMKSQPAARCAFCVLVAANAAAAE
jgi:hypothetical protein